MIGLPVVEPMTLQFGGKKRGRPKGTKGKKGKGRKGTRRTRRRKSH